MPYIAALFTFLGVVITAAVSWFIARRNTSGKVDTSDAKTLWDEASKLREAYRLETEELRKEVTSLKAEVGSLREELDALRETAEQLRRDAEQWREAAIKEAAKYRDR